MTVGFDTLAAAAMLDETAPLSLRDQAGTALGVDNWGKGVQQFGYMEGDPADILARDATRPVKSNLGDLWGEEGMATYCARDVAYTHMLYEYQRPLLMEQQGVAKLLKYLVLPSLEAYAEMEWNGLYLDPDQVGRSTLALQRQEVALVGLLLDVIDPTLMAEWVGKSNKKDVTAADMLTNEHFLRAWLFNDPRGHRLPVVAKTPARGDAKVDDKTLKQIDHPDVQRLQKIKGVRKNLSFFDQWREWLCDCGRIHPYYNVLNGGGGRGDSDEGGTVTGRRSCDRPNVQQIPKYRLMRGCVAAPPGWLFLEVDYSQLESRIMAWLSEDEAMLKVYEDPKGDIYRHFASVLYEISESEVTKVQRNKAKPFVLGLIYGMQVKGFRKYAKDMFGIDMSEDEAEHGHALFFATYPGVTRFHEQQKHLVHKNLAVESPTGRMRHLMNILSSDRYEVLKTERQAINSPDQGTGADMTVASLIELLGMAGFPEGRLLDPEQVRVVGDIHDALLFELRIDTWRENAALIMRVMETPRVITETLAVKFPLRMIAEGTIGPRWGQGTEFKLEEIDDVEVDEAWAA